MSSYHFKNRSKRIKGSKKIVWLGLLTLIIFFAGLYHLRSHEWQDKTKTVEISTENKAVQEKIDLLSLSQEAIVKDLTNGLEIGQATRGVENNVFYFTLKTALPLINRDTEFYEAWLTRQKPYSFFSVGQMTTNDVGQFVLEWTGSVGELGFFNKVIITREIKDGNSAPATKVAEGDF